MLDIQAFEAQFRIVQLGDLRNLPVHTTLIASHCSFNHRLLEFNHRGIQ